MVTQTATQKKSPTMGDLLRRLEEEGKCFYELVEGTLVEKAMGVRMSSIFPAELSGQSPSASDGLLLFPSLALKL